MNANLNSSPSKSTFVGDEAPLALKASTKNTYMTIYRRCLARSIKLRQTTQDDPVSISPINVVEDWLATVESSKPRYANTERSALLWAFGNLKEPGWQEAYTRLRTVVQEHTTAARSKQAATDRRSREPGRMIPEEDLSKLLNVLASMGANGARAQWWLVAGIASGARPIEWPDAQWIDANETVVRIYTAKVKARNAWYHVPALTFTAEDLDNEVDQLWGGRNAKNSGMSPTWHDVDFERRISTITLSEEERAELRAAQIENGVLLFRDVLIEPEYRTYVKLHMESVKRALEEGRAKIQAEGLPPKSDEDIFADDYFNPLRHTIWRASKKAFEDKLYSLVDARQTFSANRKAALGGAGAQADLGHTGYTTSRDHYAPASRAWRRYKNAPRNSDGQGQERHVEQAGPQNNTHVPVTMITGFGELA
jgi:hypothetical protein